MEHPKVLEAVNLTIGYRRRPIVEGLNFAMCAGELTALIGRNGVGKSTLLRTITGELPPISGEVLLEGRRLGEWPRRQLASKIAIVTTEPLQVGALTVRELVALGRDPHTGFSGRLNDDDKRIVAQAMQAVGINYKSDDFVACLSDGERQKALIARALAQDTPIIILDEPFSFLDVSARIDILRTLGRLCREQGKSILYSSHDVAQALRMAENVWMFTPDRRFIAGSPESLISSGDINRLFDTEGVRFDAAQNDFIAV